MARSPCRSLPGDRPRTPRQSGRKPWWCLRRCRPRRGRCSSEVGPISKSNVDQLGCRAGAGKLIAHRAQRRNLLVDVARAIETRAPTVAGRHFEARVAAPLEAERLDTDAG